MSHFKLDLPEEEIIQRYLRGETTTQLGMAYGASATSIQTVLRRHKITLSPKEFERRRKLAWTGSGEPDPTPKEIESLTAEIRDRWSDEEHYRRAGLLKPYTFPTEQDPFTYGGNKLRKL